MKVFYDYQILVRQQFGGVSRYFYEIIKNMEKLYPEYQSEVKVNKSQNYYFESYFHKKASVYKGIHEQNMRRVSNHIRTSVYLKNNINNIDILHPTYYSPYLHIDTKGKLVVTVYDMIHELFGGSKHTINNKKKILKRADKIITISEHTKRDLLSIYPWLESDKVETVYLGFYAKEHMEGAVNMSLPPEYILYVGGRDTYKNFKQFLHEVRECLVRHQSLSVLCVGGGAFNREELDLIHNLGIDNRVIQQSVTDNELVTIYKRAQCFVFPSRYEGFGLPVLEALSHECPTILNNKSSLPEVGGDAAIYFDSDESGDLESKLESLLYDNDMKMRLKVKGIKRVKQFSWENTAERTYQIYQKLLEK